MKRKDFLTAGIGFAGLLSAAPALLSSCSHDDETTTPATGNSSSGGSNSGTCTVTATETAGPFPTHTPSALVKSDITDGQTGIPLTITLIVQNITADCAAFSGAIVDIWHCNKDGEYSEYGGTGMQSTNYTAVHFLRGRQTTDVNGTVAFTSIFPAWYNGRATHIHVHIYNASGTSLLVTQIAFPEGNDSAVALVSSSAGYGNGLSGYTYNANDNVFSDGTGTEMAAVSGSIPEGFSLLHTIKVNG